MNKKGFTLVELLGVIIVLVIVMGLAVIGYSNFSSIGVRTYYQGLEENIHIAGMEYASYHNYINDIKLGDMVTIDLQSLINNAYIDKVVNRSGEDCDYEKSKIIAYKTDYNKLEYEVCLVCSDYKSTHPYCEDNIKDTRFKSGPELNKIMKKLSNSGDDSTNTENTNITKVARVYKVPSNIKLTDQNIVSTGDGTPIYMWYEDGVINWFTLDKDPEFGSDASYIFYNLKNLKDISGLETIDTSHVTKMTSMFFHCENVLNLDVSNFNTANVEDMSDMFGMCKKLKNLDVSNFNTSKVTNMSNMFEFCELLESIDVTRFDTSNVTKLHGMFKSCHSLSALDVSNFNTSKVTSMSDMFSYIENIQTLDVSNFDTSNVTNMSYMFFNLKSLESLDVSNFDTSKVTNMGYMFAYNIYETLDLSNFDTRLVTDMNAMFYDMNNLKNLILGPNFITSKVTDFSMMFNGCPKLNFDFSKIDTRSGEDMYRMLGSYQAETLDLSTFDTSNVTDMAGMFGNVKSKIIRLDNFDFSKVIYHGGNPYKNNSVNVKMFWNIADDAVIYVKNETAKNFVMERLQEANKTNQVVIVN